MTGEVIMFVGVPAGLLAGVCTLAFSRLLPRRVIIPNDGHPAMQKARLLETAEEVGLRNRSASIAKLGSGFEVAAALVATATPVVFLATAINHFHPWPFTYGAMALSRQAASPNRSRSASARACGRRASSSARVPISCSSWATPPCCRTRTCRISSQT